MEEKGLVVIFGENSFRKDLSGEEGFFRRRAIFGETYLCSKGSPGEQFSEKQFIASENPLDIIPPPRQVADQDLLCHPCPSVIKIRAGFPLNRNWSPRCVLCATGGDGNLRSATVAAGIGISAIRRLVIEACAAAFVAGLVIGIARFRLRLRPLRPLIHAGNFVIIRSLPASGAIV